ncbi:unnamed protein product, partial [Clonostachys chloroleuca]
MDISRQSSQATTQQIYKHIERLGKGNKVVETVKTAAKDLKDKIVNNWDGTLKTVNTAMGVATGVTVIKAMNSKPKRGLEDIEERDIEKLHERLRRNR